MIKPITTYIGIGLAFPIILEDGKPVLSSLEDLIESSIRNILIWPFNTRYFEKSFGSRINELIEEPNTGILNTLLEEFTRTALETWERRINIIEITSESSGLASSLLTIKYSIKLDNTVHDLTQNLILG